MAGTTNQRIERSNGYVLVDDAVASGLVSFNANTQFATSDSGVPDSDLIGHSVKPNEPRRYNLSDGKLLYVKASTIAVIFVIVDED